LFITWKSCFVRYHAERIPVFLGTVVPLLACGLLASGYQVQRTGNSINCWQSQWYTFVTTILAAERRCGLPIVIAGLAVLVFAGAIERVRPLTLAEVFGHAVSPLQNQILAVGESAKDPGWRRSTHDSQMQKIREANPIPKVEGSVDVFPSKLIVGFAHGLEMRPRPILQSYAAFTPELIERDVGHFKGDNAPDDVLISVGEIDGRLPTMEDSRAWFELLSRYDLTDSSCELIRLNRRKHLALVLSQEPALSTTVKFGEQVNLPLGLAGPVWCRIQIEPSLVGRAASILYRLPELRLRVYCDRGIDREFRLLRGAVRSGFLISPVVDTRDDLIRLWQWRDGFDAENTSREGRVVSIVCSAANQGVGELLFKKDVTVEFFNCIKRVDPMPESVRPTDVATRERSSF